MGLLGQLPDHIGLLLCQLHDPVLVDLDAEIIFSQIDGVLVHFGVDVLAPRLLADHLLVEALALCVTHVLDGHQVPGVTNLHRPADLARPEGKHLFLQSGQRAAVIEDAVLRVRPKAMTAAVIIAGLLPIMFGSGTGSEVMRRIAAPMVGGMVAAPLVSMLVIPLLYLWWKGRGMGSQAIT